MCKCKDNYEGEVAACAGDVPIFELKNNTSKATLRAEALVLLVQGLPITHIADVLQVHRSTVHRWIADPEFQRDLALYRDLLIEETFDLQVLASKRATLRLIELMESDDPRIALSAIKTAAPLKDHYQAMDHERRVRFLEDNLGAG